MIKKLLNPFNYIAGGKSFFIGIAVIFATSFAGYLTNTHFPDIISVKTGLEVKLHFVIAQNIINWLSISLLLYIASLIFSKSSVRITDIFGTQALARAPYLIAAILNFSNSITQLGEHIMWKYLNKGEPAEISALDISLAVIFIIITVLLTVWMVTLMYNSFRVSSNIKGLKSGIIFTVVFIISVVISTWLNFALFNQIYL